MAPPEMSFYFSKGRPSGNHNMFHDVRALCHKGDRFCRHT